MSGQPRKENLLMPQMALISGSFPNIRYREPLLAVRLSLISCRPNTHTHTHRDTRDLKQLFMARGIMELMGIKVLVESTAI